MRNMLAVLAALSLIAGPGFAADASAEAPRKKRHAHAQAQVRKPAGERAAPAPDGYTERNANTLRFGSAAWWDQMLRESRAGTCCN